MGIVFHPTMPCTALIEYQKWNPRDVNAKMLAKMSHIIFLHTFLLTVSPKTYLTTNKKKQRLNDTSYPQCKFVTESTS